jgi:uncharacterized membrane protein
VPSVDIGGAVQEAIEFAGRFHPFLVHFPVALILTAVVAEVLFALRGGQHFAAAALFLVTAAAWTSLPAFLAGFAAAAGQVFEGDLARVFAVHRIVGVTTPMLAFLAAGMGHSTRRTGQVWEQILYRIFLVLAAASVAVSGAYGGLLVHGRHFFSP